MSKVDRDTADGLTGAPMRKVVIASFAGALLEWYDFFLFGTASGIVFGKLFFPGSDPTMGMIAAFATFGVGFLTRPLGGIVFGHFGDRIGRKATLIWTVAIIGTSTFLIGLLPTYAEIGVAAPVLLALLRLLQGFGLGGEYGGAALMTIESAPQSRRGFLGSLPQTAASAGIMLATGSFALCNALLTEEQFLSWGWRLPFLASLLMLFVGLYIRVHIEETCDFRAATAEADAAEPDRPLPIVELFRGYRRNIVLAFGARLAETVASNVINAFSIAYLVVELHFDRETALTGMLAGSAIGILVCPVVGWLSDRLGQRPLYLVGAAFCAVFVFPFFGLLDTREVWPIWAAFVVAYNLGPTTMFAVQPTMFARMFGTGVRYTGLSFAYQFSAILGGLTPLIASTLLTLGGGRPWYVAAYLAAIAAISFVCVWMIGSGRADPVLPSSEEVR